MSELNWIDSYGFIGTRLFDLPSLLICLLAIIVLGYLYKVPNKLLIVLTAHCLLPFVLNDVLFPAKYMPDQFKYWTGVNLIRSGQVDISQALSNLGNVFQASAFLSILPFPTPASIISLGFYNTFLYIILFFILYTKNIFTKLSIWFYLLYPSLALYSALTLRETLIFFFMTLAVIYARESKIFRSALCLLPLYLIKFQNFFILGPIILIYAIFSVAKKGMGIFKSITILLIALLSLLLSAPLAIPLINKYRIAMHIEDGGDIDDISVISGPLEFINEGLTSGIYFLSKPLPWEASGLLPLIQSFENSVLLIILFIITRQAWKKQIDKLAFWLLFLAISMSIYGLVVSNYGTAVRYRYPFIVIYILFVCADCNIQKLFPNKQNTPTKQDKVIIRN